MKFSTVFLRAAKEISENNRMSCLLVRDLYGTPRPTTWYKDSSAVQYYVELLVGKGEFQYLTQQMRCILESERQHLRVIMLLFAYQVARSEGV